MTQTANAGQGRSVRCERCGGTITLATLAPRATCSHYGFYLESTDGGLCANASADVIKRLHGRPMDVLGLSPLPGMMTAWLRTEGEPA